MTRARDGHSKRVSPGPVKHSVTLAGHRTSLSLEPAFWDALGEIAEVRGVSLAHIVEKIDAARGQQGLSSAARIFVLNAIREAG